MADQQKSLYKQALKATLQASSSGTYDADGGPNLTTPTITALSALVGHGGLHSLLDGDLMAARLAPLTAGLSSARGQPMSANEMAAAAQGEATNFFTHLVQNPYQIPSNLITRLTFPIHSLSPKGGHPDKGVTYSDPQDEKTNPASFEGPIPAAFTFVGQFIDHDLTMNALNLFDPQVETVEDISSPLLDLDSVYGPRKSGYLPAADTPEQLEKYLFDGPRFRLKHRKDGIVDFYRDLHPASPMLGQALIADKRNDENQMVSQIHLLVMRHHNRLIDDKIVKTKEEARLLTLHTWQYIVLHDYLPRIIRSDVLNQVVTSIEGGSFAGIKHVPLRNVVTGAYSIGMPHEFAIGFRFGHSQLKASYKINATNVLPLFDNTLTDLQDPPEYVDLRGSQILTAAHTIDWKVFLGDEQTPPPPPVLGNAIDHLVTNVVFDLPESTIPDDVKEVGNLPFRNLSRSRQIGLCAGEDLAEFYGVPVLSDTQIDDASEIYLYKQTSKNRRTPLWYYLLREAEATGKNGGLGELGSRLVAEVIVGGIFYNPKPERLPEKFVPTHLPTSNPAKTPRFFDFAVWASG